MKFGVHLQHFRPEASRTAIEEVARAAEELGLDSVWVSDHVILPRGPAQTFGAVFYDPLLSLTWAAAKTERVRLGTSVLITPYRHPAILAKELATLDALSGGRTTFGFGVGWMAQEFDILGVPFRERAARTDEYLRAMIALWTQDDPELQGRFVRFANVDFYPKPVQKPHPPLEIGGMSEQALRRVVAFGAAWQPILFRETLDAIERGRETLGRLARAAGHGPAAHPITLRAPMRVLDQPAGEPRLLIGTPDEIRAAIRRIAAVGVSQIIVDTFYIAPELVGQPTSAILVSLERFAREVMPEFR
jgi:probable F420-dependent oxidoreductase